MANPASISSELARSLEQARRGVAQGTLPLVDLFQVTHELHQNGHQDTAIQLYRDWLAGPPSPLAYAAWFNLAIALNARGDSAGAESAYRSAIAHHPRFSEGHLNLGTLLERAKRPQEALDAWRVVVGYADPANAAERAFLVQALNNIGRLLEIQRDYPAAEDALTRSLHLDARQPDVITHWVHLRQKQCKWPVFSSSASGVPEAELMAATSALGMLSGSGDPAMQLASAQRFVREKVIQDVPQLSGPAGYEHTRLRVGYLSSDFCSHAVSILTAELYGLHDRARVEMFGFDWSNDDGSPLRARVVAGFDQHVRIHDLTDEEAARLIRSHEIDILVDLHGLTLGARPNILSYRPAPVQITWLGLPGTTALPQIDYVIADPFVLPPELEPYFTEKPLHMPRTFQVNDRERRIGARPTRAGCGLPEEAFVFCAFNNNFKITQEIFQTWMAILRRVPDSVLWVVGDNEQVRTNLARQAELAGVPASRLHFADRALPADYLARFQVADLFLDTIPFNGGTTASDALWAGLPVLTCSDRTFSSRMAGSLLRAADLPELVTFNLRDYEEKAVSLAGDRARVEAMKRQLVDNRLSCALFDTPRFARDLEDAYERVALGRRVAAPAAEAAPATVRLPLVSVLIAAGEDCGSEAVLQSLGTALAQQGWPRLEIVISDASRGEALGEALEPLLGRSAQLRYLRAPGLDAAANLQNAYRFAQGEFIALLPPGDLFHPQKLAVMMGYMATQPNVGMVASWTQQMDAQGNYLTPAQGNGPLYPNETRIGGRSLGDLMLANSQNIAGGPGGVLFRKALAGPRFGHFLGRDYIALPEVATWLAVLAQADCVYLPQALNYAAVPASKGLDGRIAAQVEWLQLLCDAHEQDVYARNRALLHESLTSKLVSALMFLSATHEEVKRGAYELERIHAVVRQANTILLAP
ncbi:glycosyltransferase [Pseudoduganella sp. SL102]|uniref:O-linked N-acetylglucosamine transferase family protein n=1 Tax=Pseudoduganella sp. SL102 TaxID=2995154 RepID=UPI00248ACAEF|nr:glycosyltransferase [Pseudoduganella sp. SL102]WBS02791.1 glycosyltransferase [Pseudoduganella sp. SL102]